MESDRERASKPPGGPAGGRAADPRAERADRLAAALRDNLKKRKAQARGRNAPPTATGPKAPDEEGGAGGA